MVKVSIVILNWNRKKDTLECLKSLEGLSTKHKVQIIVVDNASTDDSRKVIDKKLKKLNKKDNFSCELIRNKENLGFAAGNNVGMRHAVAHGADYVLLLNNDTLVDKKLVDELVSVAKSKKKAGLLSPKIYFAEGFEFHKEKYKKKDLGKVIWYAGGKIDWDNVYGKNHGVDEIDKGQYDKIEETDFVTGACMLIRKEAIEDVGFFDEKYYMYLEDADLSVRMKKNGWQVLYAPPAHLWHKVAQSSAIGSKLNDYFIIRNRLLFGMGYASVRTKFALYRESLRLLLNGRKWQQKGVIDFYLMRYGKGSWHKS
jgi:GT2 family glycosyltransferase